MDRLRQEIINALLDRARSENYVYEPMIRLDLIAAEALTMGYDSPSLRELAGLNPSSQSQFRTLLLQAARELGFNVQEDTRSRWLRIRPMIDQSLASKVEIAVETIQCDLSVALPGVEIEPVPLTSIDELLEIVIGIKSGGYWTGGSRIPMRNDRLLLASVAKCTQDCITEVLHKLWPECPQHERGVHVASKNESDVWWCKATGGHVLSEVGKLPSVLSCEDSPPQT